MQDHRNEIIKKLRWSFFGPDNTDSNKDIEQFAYTKYSDPGKLFLTGILSPQLNSNEDEDSLDDTPFSKTGTSDSSFGFTFCVPKRELKMTIGADFSIYKKGKDNEGKEIFLREPHFCKFIVEMSKFITNNRLTYNLIEVGTKKDKIELVITKRTDIKNSDGDIYTLSIVHLGKEKGFMRPWDKTIFHIRLFSSISEDFVHLPQGAPNLNEDMKQSSLLYRNVKRYALGHGCGVNWNLENRTINSTFFPEIEIPVFTHKEMLGEALDMKYWASEGCKVSLLEIIPLEYEKWLNNVSKKIIGLDQDQINTFEKNKQNVQKVCERIHQGIKILNKDSNSYQSFKWMNEAMLLQQIRSKSTTTPIVEVNGKYIEGDIIDIDINDVNTWPVEDVSRFGKWRLFQMAFILMCIPDIVNEKKDEYLDLIWFPTGGGKTEAYLGLSAFLLINERLGNFKSEGVQIIMRYTLRLLTAQQFERAATLILALEDIRYNNKSILGEYKFSIGLWVGGGVTFNSHGTSSGKYTKIPRSSNEWYDSLNYTYFQSWPWVLQKCPRCSREFGIKKYKGQKISFGVTRVANSNKIVFSCKCSKEIDGILPIFVVDEDIYSELPSMVIGTVDKFARISWQPISAKVIGVNANGIGKHSKLSMIIQDELHLLNGPLGTVSGLYEAALDYLIERTGAKPKRIGSSATLAMAREQCRDLYGVSTESVHVFPPPLCDWDDNYFSIADKTKKGRKYVGLYANGSPSNKTTQYRLYASLLQSGGDIVEEFGQEQEGYSTLINYFNSTKDMGHALSLMGDDVPKELKQLKFRFKVKSDRWKKVDINDGLVQLHGNVSSDVVQKDMQRLLEPFGSKRHVHTVLATNMISVGLDVPRLSLMTIIHQPKSMSEYIQASSRIGRGKTPGVVFVMLSALRNRDRSHLEDFVITHEKMYALVEPSSLTPFSISSMERALPGVLIAMFRNDTEFGSRDVFTALQDELKEKVRNFLINRIKIVDPNELDEFIDQFNDFCKSWNFGGYRSFGKETIPNRADSPIMVPFLTPTSWEPMPFQVLQSMRNVDSGVELKQIER